LLLTRGNIAGDVWFVGSLVDHLTCDLTRESGVQQQAKRATMYPQAIGLIPVSLLVKPMLCGQFLFWRMSFEWRPCVVPPGHLSTR